MMMVSMDFLLRTLILIRSISFAYELNCPEESHRIKRGKLICKNAIIYTCLLDIINNQFIEKCNGEEHFPEGSKAVYRDHLDIHDCSTQRYQPFIYVTTKLSECVYLKSGCTEEGQLPVISISTKENKVCACDNESGYYFIHEPTTSESCNPSKEDCSCYKRFSNISENRSDMVSKPPVTTNISNEDVCNASYSTNIGTKYKRRNDFVWINVYFIMLVVAGLVVYFIIIGRVVFGEILIRLIGLFREVDPPDE